MDTFRGNSGSINENLQVFNVGVKILNSPAITKKKGGLKSNQTPKAV